MATQTTSPMSERRSGPANGGCLVLFGLVFFAIGFCAFFFTFLRPFFQMQAARSWTATPCVITSSSVASHRGDGTTYSVEVEYTYHIGDQIYYGNRYGFVTGSSSGYASKQAVVAALPPGMKATCYVNPSNPADAVLNRGVTGDFWIGLIPLIFCAVGLGIMIGGLRMNRASRTTLRSTSWEPKNAPYGLPASDTTPTAIPAGSLKSQTQLVQELQSSGSTSAFQDTAAIPRNISSVPQAGSGPVTLKARSSKTGAFFAVLIFGLVWNGFIGGMVFSMLRKPGSFEWFGLLFMTPFVLVGLGVLGVTIYQFLALFGPKLEITVSSPAVMLGDTLNIEWKLSGNQRVQRLKIYLEGREEATYRRGTDTYTDRNTFYVEDISDITSGAAQGSGRITVPAYTMHSFEAKNNKILWQIVVKGEIPIWPDLKEEFALAVLPKVLPKTNIS